MRIERFEPESGASPELVRACYGVYLAGKPEDDPFGPVRPFAEFERGMTRPWPDATAETWLGSDGDGEVAGWYRIEMPVRENRHVAHIAVTVRPARRRAGLGTELVRHAAERARAAGRATLSGFAREDGGGHAFGLKLGASQGMTDVRRAQRIGPVPEAVRAGAMAASGGYSLLSWAGPVPEDLMPGLVRMQASVEDDVPREADRDPWASDAERIRAAERRMTEDGRRFYTVAARSQTDGELAAFTFLIVDPEAAGRADQAITGVARPHRGHRLGLRVKIGMLDLLAEREPAVTEIHTWNAEQNKYMIAVNDALGYEVLDRWVNLDLEVAQC